METAETKMLKQAYDAFWKQIDGAYAIESTPAAKSHVESAVDQAIDVARDAIVNLLLDVADADPLAANRRYYYRMAAEHILREFKDNF